MGECAQERYTRCRHKIYMIQCNRCNLQYIGETKRRLKDRFNEHRRTIDNPDAKSEPTTAAKHFLSSPNHTANDIPLTNWVRGPYRKLRTEFFPPRFMAQARSARAINRRGKNEDP